MTVPVRKLSLSLFTCLILIAGAAMAQSDLDQKLATGDTPGNLTLQGGCTAIPDDGYDGSIGTMTCLTYTDASDLEITDVNVNIGVNHTWIGDLTVKVVSPAGTVSTMQSRAGYAETGDDGTGCCGDSSDLSETFPFTYDDTAGSAVSAEDMGATILGGDVACDVDGICDYIPAPDTGPGVSLADFNGEESNGDWMVCVGDSAGGDAGEICSVDVTIDGNSLGAANFDITIPTLSQVGLALLILMLAGAGIWIVRRR